MVTLLRGTPGARTATILMQIVGACAGTLLAHLMFGLPILSSHMAERAGPGQWLGEFVATFGLLFTISAASERRIRNVPALVALWIVAAYWFTSSTSFANPAVTIGRALTGSFAGIRWIDVPPFILAQLAGGAAGHRSGIFISERNSHESHHLA